MNTLYFTQRTSARILAAVALFSLIASLVPMQASSAPKDTVSFCHVPSADPDKVALFEDKPPSSLNGHTFGESGHELDFLIENEEDMQRCLDLIDPPPVTQCNDGVDNADTEDTLIDLNDPGCSDPTDNDESNTPAPGTLNITKVILGIQNILSSAFSFIVNGGTSVAFETDNTNSVPSVPAGAYTVVEAGVTGGNVTVGPNTYSVGYSAGCTSSLVAGGSANCTITNTYVPPNPTTGTILVDKVTNPALDTQSFAFTTTGTGYNGFSLTDTAAPNSQTVVAGTYSVAETVPGGWTLTGVSCVSSLQDTEVVTALELDAGETITCTFNNMKDGVLVVNGCTNPLATNYNDDATPGNPDAADCDFDYVSQCITTPANLLTNASFEDPVVNGGNGTAFGAGFYGVFASITDWTATNSIELWNNILNLASDGAQSTELDVANSTTISQTVDTVPGAIYELRFDFAARSDNSAQAENSVIASADASPVVTASTDNTAFTTYGATFVAGDASTTVSFADNGVSNGVGTVIDNAVLCLVQAPAPTQGTLNVIKMLVGTTTVDESAFSFSLNGAASTSFDGTDGVNTLTLAAGTYDVVETSAPGYTTTYSNCDNVVVTAGQTSTCTITNTLITSTPQVCSVNVISNLTNTVNATGTVIVENQPGVWVDNIVGSLAQWIWGAASTSPISGTVDETQTFTKTFVWNGPVTGATLRLASDNMYSVTLNGTEVASSTDEDNFSSVDTVINISDNIIQGTNTLAISVTNDANNQTTLAGNPAGLIYDLTVVGNTQDNCTQVPGGGGDNDALSCSLTASDTSIRRGRSVDLDWTSVGGATSATLTGEDGVVTTVGTSGGVTIDDLDDDTTFTLTVTDGEDTESCSVSVNTTSGGGGGGGNNNNNNNNNGPDGDVLGDSDSRDPDGLVLGDQVDAVPTGAPNTGKGGVSTLVLGQLLAMPRRRNHN